MRFKKILVLVACIIFILGLGIGSGFSTVDEIKNWYINLNQPVIKPPNWIFGPVWTMLYTFLGIILFRIIYSKSNNKKQLLILFSVQFIINLSWSSIFFGSHQLLFGGFAISFLLFFSIALAIKIKPSDKISFYLLLPYIAWVSFATLLNWCFWYLNK